MDANVMLYALATCEHCKQVRRYLDENEVAYKFVYLDMTGGEERKELMKTIQRLNPSITFPTIVVGDKVVVGFKQQELKEALNIR